MSTLLWGMHRDGVTSDTNVVRSTTEIVDHDTPAAVSDHAPEMGDVDVDGNPNLGMVNRQKASKWTERRKGVPGYLDGASADHESRINRQVASSGTAADRESRGIAGHGTMEYAVGIEPVADLKDGGRLGNDYFVTHKRSVQDSATNRLSSPIINHDDVSAVMGEGKRDARNAATAAMYEAFGAGFR